MVLKISCLLHQNMSKGVITLPKGELPAPDFVSRPCLGIFQYFTSSKTHTPGHREGCAPPGEDRKTWVYADTTELLWNYLDSANQTSVRYLWQPSFCRKRGFAPTKQTWNTVGFYKKMYEMPGKLLAASNAPVRLVRSPVGGCCCARKPSLHPRAEGELCRAGKVWHSTARQQLKI